MGGPAAVGVACDPPPSTEVQLVRFRTIRLIKPNPYEACAVMQVRAKFEGIGQRYLLLGEGGQWKKALPTRKETGDSLKRPAIPWNTDARLTLFARESPLV
ncbi:hypothetical protein FOMPIDRAFT_1055826 [Fomitopsis schrenkii]|uniref:Uncharacterized protein n=1 Tax=Fomitopsis schrenkii TaxID=2126942 RepID=S8F3R5_FOMSC|nr:hypothetical protein FOMPIDRAFT_1055826 [Fomitopsis schrenkii]